MQETPQLTPEEVQRLLAENTALEGDVNQLLEQNRQLTAENARLQDRITALRTAMRNGLEGREVADHTTTNFDTSVNEFLHPQDGLGARVKVAANDTLEIYSFVQGEDGAQQLELQAGFNYAEGSPLRNVFPDLESLLTRIENHLSPIISSALDTGKLNNNKQAIEQRSAAEVVSVLTELQNANDAFEQSASCVLVASEDQVKHQPNLGLVLAALERQNNTGDNSAKNQRLKLSEDVYLDPALLPRGSEKSAFINQLSALIGESTEQITARLERLSPENDPLAIRAMESFIDSNGEVIRPTVTDESTRYLNDKKEKIQETALKYSAYFYYETWLNLKKSLQSIKDKIDAHRIVTPKYYLWGLGQIRGDAGINNQDEIEKSKAERKALRDTEGNFESQLKTLNEFARARGVLFLENEDQTRQAIEKLKNDLEKQLQSLADEPIQVLVSGQQFTIPVKSYARVDFDTKYDTDNLYDKSYAESMAERVDGAVEQGMSRFVDAVSIALDVFTNDHAKSKALFEDVRQLEVFKDGDDPILLLAGIIRGLLGDVRFLSEQQKPFAYAAARNTSRGRGLDEEYRGAHQQRQVKHEISERVYEMVRADRLRKESTR